MPAVAVIRRRLVLVIFIRFKGYLDGKLNLNGYFFTRVLYEKGSILEVMLQYFNNKETGKGEGCLLLKTDVEGRRLG